MKMKRNLIILGIVLVLAVALVIAAPNLKPPAPSASPTATAAPETVLSQYTTDAVTEVTVESNGQSYSAYKKGEVFTLKGQEAFQFDQTTMGSLFYNAAAVSGDLVEENPADLAKYGLASPQAKVTAKYSDGQSNVFLLGDKSVAGNTYYLMKQGDNKVIMVWMNIGNSYLAKPDSMLVKDKFTVTQEEIESVTVLENGQTTLEMTTLSQNKGVSISPWAIVKPWKRSVDSEELSTFLTAILGVEMGDIVEGDARDLAKYGLDKPQYDMTISGKGKADRLLIGNKKDSNYFYVKFSRSNTVYTVSASSLEFTKTTAYKLMDKMIILVNITNATGVEFQGFGQHARLDIEQKPTLDEKGEKKLDANGNQMYDQVFTVDGKPMDDKASRAYYQRCIGLATHSLIPEGWKPSGDPVAVLTYTRNEEPRVIKIEFMAYDNDFFAVRADGETHFLIKQSNLKQVAEDLEKFLAGTLVTPEPTEKPAATPAASGAAVASPAATAAPAPASGTASPLVLIILLVVAAAIAVAIVVAMKRMKGPQKPEGKE